MCGLKHRFTKIKKNLRNNFFLMVHFSPFTCHLSPTPTATSTYPPPANSPIMHCKMVCQKRKQRNILNPKKLSKPSQKGILNLQFYRYALWADSVNILISYHLQPNRYYLPLTKNTSHLTLNTSNHLSFIFWFFARP